MQLRKTSVAFWGYFKWHSNVFFKIFSKKENLISITFRVSWSTKKFEQYQVAKQKQKCQTCLHISLIQLWLALLGNIQIFVEAQLWCLKKIWLIAFNPFQHQHGFWDWQRHQPWFAVNLKRVVISFLVLPRSRAHCCCCCCCCCCCWDHQTHSMTIFTFV